RSVGHAAQQYPVGGSGQGDRGSDPGPRSRSAGRPAGLWVAGRRVLILLFWLGLIGAIVPWWLDTAPGSGTRAAPTMIAAGRITGIVGGYLLLVQVLLMSRVRLLERLIGAGQLLSWHRDMGGLLIVVILAHAVLITIGYARSHESSVLAEAAQLFSTY